MKRRKLLSSVTGAAQKRILVKSIEVVGWLIALSLFAFACRAAFV